jgi:hypothetical protein
VGQESAVTEQTGCHFHLAAPHPASCYPVSFLPVSGWAGEPPYQDPNQINQCLEYAQRELGASQGKAALNAALVPPHQQPPGLPPKLAGQLAKPLVWLAGFAHHQQPGAAHGAK